MRLIDGDALHDTLFSILLGCRKSHRFTSEQDSLWNTAIAYVDLAPTIATKKHGRWISVKDDFPEKDGRYLVYEPGVGVYDAFTTSQNGKYFWWENSLKPRNVTHWMQLPEPPTGAMDTNE